MLLGDFALATKYFDPARNTSARTSSWRSPLGLLKYVFCRTSSLSRYSSSWRSFSAERRRGEEEEGRYGVMVFVKRERAPDFRGEDVEGSRKEALNVETTFVASTSAHSSSEGSQRLLPLEGARLREVASVAAWGVGTCAGGVSRSRTESAELLDEAERELSESVEPLVALDVSFCACALKPCTVCLSSFWRSDDGDCDFAFAFVVSSTQLTFRLSFIKLRGEGVSVEDIDDFRSLAALYFRCSYSLSFTFKLSRLPERTSALPSAFFVGDPEWKMEASPDRILGEPPTDGDRVLESRRVRMLTGSLGGD
jgi:hypothetical protein